MGSGLEKKEKFGAKHQSTQFFKKQMGCRFCLGSKAEDTFNRDWEGFDHQSTTAEKWPVIKLLPECGSL